MTSPFRIGCRYKMTIPGDIWLSASDAKFFAKRGTVLIPKDPCPTCGRRQRMTSASSSLTIGKWWSLLNKTRALKTLDNYKKILGISEKNPLRESLLGDNGDDWGKLLSKSVREIPGRKRWDSNMGSLHVACLAKFINGHSTLLTGSPITMIQTKVDSSNEVQLLVLPTIKIKKTETDNDPRFWRIVSPYACSNAESWLQLDDSPTGSFQFYFNSWVQYFHNTQSPVTKITWILACGVMDNQKDATWIVQRIK